MGAAKLWPQFFAALSVSVGAWALGTVIAWTANISGKLKDGKLNDIPMSDDELGWVGSIMPLGAMVACIPIGLLADFIGRKPTVILVTIPFILGWIIVILAKSAPVVYGGRFCLGFAAGSFCVVAPMYTGEIAQVEVRGILGTFFQLFITLGILYAQVMGHLLSVFVFNIACLIVPVIFGLLFMIQPESPVYYIKKGNKEAADKSFNKLRGTDYDHGPEVAAIQKMADEEKARASFKEAMKLKSSKKTTIICFMLMFYQQLSGINAVMFYALEIFKVAGSTLDGAIATISIGVVQVIATIVSALIVDKFGRKILLIISALFMGIATFLLGIFFSLKIHNIMDDAGLKTIGFIPVLSLNIFIIAFSLGFGPIPWLAVGEMFTPEIKGKCSAAAATFNWFLAFVVTKVYFYAVGTLGGDVTFYIFTGVSISAVFYVIIFMPETKGKTLQEIVTELNE